jgi:hypothetical protein
MDQVIKAFNAAVKSGMSKCEAIRAVVQEFIDIPRGEMQKVLVEGCKLNPGTVRTQCQLGRTMANKAEQPVAKAPAKQKAIMPVVAAVEPVSTPLITPAPKSSKRKAA